MRGVGGMAGAGLLAAGLALWTGGAGPWLGLIGLILLAYAIWNWWEAEVPQGAPIWLRHAVLLAFAAEALLCVGWFMLCLRTFGQDVDLMPDFADGRHLPLVATLSVVASAALAWWALEVRRDRDLALWAALALGALAGAAELYSLRFGTPPAFAGLRLVNLVPGLAALALVRGGGRLALTLGVMAWTGVAGLWAILLVAAWLA